MRSASRSCIASVIPRLRIDCEALFGVHALACSGGSGTLKGGHRTSGSWIVGSISQSTNGYPVQARAAIWTFCLQAEIACNRVAIQRIGEHGVPIQTRELPPFVQADVALPLSLIFGVI